MMEEEIEGGELVWSSVGVAGQEEEEEGGLRNLVQKRCRQDLFVCVCVCERVCVCVCVHMYRSGVGKISSFSLFLCSHLYVYLCEYV